MHIKNNLLFLVVLLSFFSLSAQDVLMQDGTFNQCSGTFLDTGGADGNYSTGEDFTITICPDDPTLITTLEFTQFELAAVSTFTIYDSDTVDPSQLIGTFTETLADNPELNFISASDENPTGCLTIVFDASFFSNPGWAATIGCREPCDVTTASIAQVEPSEFNTGTGNFEIGNFLPITFEIDPVFTSNNGNSPQYVWDFGDGSAPVTTSVPIVQHEFTALGEFNVTVNIIDDFGCSNENAVTITVEVISRSGFTCADAQPFCAGGEVYFFPNSSTAGGGIPTAESGPDYGCLSSQPYPAWFFIQIERAGDIEFLLEQDTDQDFGGNGLDVDFKIWGPFDSATGNCDDLNASNEVPDIRPDGDPLDGCSFSAAPIENMGIPNAQVGEFYIIIITNFSRNQGFISFQQTNEDEPDAGTTSCSILGDDINACEDETVTVFTNVPGGDTFQWEIFNTETDSYEVIPDETESSLEVTQPGGTYRATVSGPNTFIEDEITVNFFENPEIITPITELVECTTSPNENFFDLTEINLSSLGVENPELFEILYYNNLGFAQIGNPAQAIPGVSLNNYDSTEVDEEIIVRIQNIQNPSCFVLSSFTLIENFVDIGGDLEDISSCILTDETITFDLTANEILALAGQDSTDFSVFYYENEVDANSNEVANAIENPSAFEVSTEGTTTIFINVQNNINQGCFASSSFEITAFRTPEITLTPGLSQCGDFTLTQIFDLTQNDATELGIANSSEAQLTYYNTQANADEGIDPIPDPENYEPNASLETIFVRAENTNSSACFTVDNFSIQIFDVEANPVDDINLCGTTGQTPFDLTQQNSDIFGPNQDATTHSISYHTSQADAQGGADPIPNPDSYVNTTNPETIWARVQNIDDTSCFALSSFQVRITEEPIIINTPENLSQCGDYSLTQVFNLTDNNTASLGIENAAETQITYYNTLANANNGESPIPDPENYVPANEQENIFIRATNINDPDCFAVAEFSIEIFNVEIFTANDLEDCDDGTGTETSSFNLVSNNEIILGSNQNASTHNIAYFESEADAIAGNNPISEPLAYDNITNPQTIWARVENIDNPVCFEISSFDILVTDSAPINTDIDPLIACDDDNDGFFNNFDLDSVTSQITLDNPDVVVSYHLTSSDAQNNVGAVSSPYSNVVESQQTLYFRALDTNNGCEQFGELLLQIFDSPLLTAIEEPLIGCDDDDDNFIFFDLTQVEDQVLGSIDTTGLEITYHLSLAEAEDGINALGNPDNFSNTENPQTIWIRVTDTNSPVLCSNIEPFDIFVESLPEIVNPEPLELCDDEDSGDLSDETSVFDLNDKISEITQGNNELNVEFFESETDLDNDNPITTIDAFVNTTNPQTLEVKVTSETTGCSTFTNLTLVVNPVPSLAPELEPLEVCDPDNDGFAEFDLEAIIIDILNNEPDVTISFHLTLADAELGSNAIDTTSPYGTSNPNQQTIYVRAENTGPNGDDGTGCFDTRPLDLIVIPSPNIEELQDLTRCDDESPNGFATFDLTENTDLAIGNQDPTDLLVTYHETQIDAEQGTFPIAVPSNYTNNTNPQIIYVRIENQETGCVDLYNSANDINNTFTLTVEALPIVNTPSILEVCDDDDNDDPFPQTTFDLTVKEPEIIGEANVPANLEFSYYASQSDFDNDFPIADPTSYVNTSQPQSIFISVVDNATENSCSNSTVLTINVLPLPSPSETDLDVLRLEGCDDDNDGVANQPFDLTESGVLIASSENVSLSYYLTEEAANTENSVDLIADPTAYVNDPALNLVDEDGNPTTTQIIYVRVDNDVQGNFCYVIVQIELKVNPAPVLNSVGDPFAYTLCEDDNTNPGVVSLFSLDDVTNNLWDFTNGSSDVIIPLLDTEVTPTQILEDFDISYHLTEQDAEDGINAISAGQSVSDGDILFIRVTNLETSCFNNGAIGQVRMVIQPRPNIAQENPENIRICADNINSTSSAMVDLTQQDEAINPGLPDDTMVLYYSGMMDFNNGNAIEDPTNFTTSQSPQTIIAEVVNTNTLCESSTFVSFEVIIDPLPPVEISGFDGNIVCFDSGGDLINNDVSPPVIDTGLSEDIYTFEWRLNDVLLPASSSSIEADLPGIYTVTAINTETGCFASSSAEIIESTPPEFNVSILTPAFSVNHVVEVNTITGSGDFEFQLDDGEWISLAPGQTTLIFSNIAPGMHVIRGRDSGGCGEIEFSFNIIDYPPFFTPNQDGFNDTWNIPSLAAEQPNAKIFIFDRYGKLLKQISPAGEGWDGTYNGTNMPAQDYWFRVEFVEPSTDNQSNFKAHFTLKR